MNLIPDRFQHAAKGVVAAIGGVAALVLQLVGALAPGLPDAVVPVASAVVAVATFVGVYLVPNLQRILDADPVDDVGEPAAAPAQVVTSAPATMSTPADPDQPAAGVPPSDGTGVITDPDVANPSPDFTPEVDGADDLTAADDGPVVTHDGSLG